MNTVKIEVARAMFRLAWADGQIRQAEVDFISTLLERLGFRLAERLALLDEALSLPYQQVPKLDAVVPERADRLAILGQCIAVSFADGEAHPRELEILGKLATHWGITVEELEHLRQQVGAGGC